MTLGRLPSCAAWVIQSRLRRGYSVLAGCDLSLACCRLLLDGLPSEVTPRRHQLEFHFRLSEATQSDKTMAWAQVLGQRESEVRYLRLFKATHPPGVTVATEMGLFDSAKLITLE